MPNPAADESTECGQGSLCASFLCRPAVGFSFPCLYLWPGPFLWLCLLFCSSSCVAFRVERFVSCEQGGQGMRKVLLDGSL